MLTIQPFRSQQRTSCEWKNFDPQIGEQYEAGVKTQLLIIN